MYYKELGKSSKTCELRLTAGNVAETLEHGLTVTSTEVDFPITKDISFFVEVINATQVEGNGPIQIISKCKLKVQYYENKTLWFKINIHRVAVTPSGEMEKNVVWEHYDYDSKVVESGMPGSTFNLKTITRLKSDTIVDNKIDFIVNIEEVRAVRLIYVPWNDRCETSGALSNAYEDDHFKDVKFVIEGESLMAHKAICAAKSKVFNAMFKSDTRERQEGVVEILDTRMVAFKALIEYFYDILDIDECDYELQKELLILADKYDVQDLKQDCERALRSELNKENAVEVLILADKHNCQHLKKCALQVVRFLLKDCSNFQLLYTNLELINEVFDEIDDLINTLPCKKQRLY